MIANSVSQTFVWGKISDKYQAPASLIVIGETIAAFGYVLAYYFHIYLWNTKGSVAVAYGIIADFPFLSSFGR